jgi:hypothetical protein
MKSTPVIPAKAGIQLSSLSDPQQLDPRFRGGDALGGAS